MEIREHKKRKFLSTLERAEPLILDSSAATTFMECPRKYFYRYVVGFTERETPIYFAFGSAYHLFWEKIVLNEKNLEGEALKNHAMTEAGNYFLKNAPRTAVNARFDFMTLPRLLLSCNVAWEFYLKEKAQGAVQIIASEQPLNTTLPNGEQIGGRADQIVRWKTVWGRDFKTTSKKLDYFERMLAPNDQMLRYTYIEGKVTGENVKGQLVLALHNSKDRTKPGPYLHQFIVSVNEGQLRRWEEEQILLTEEMKLARDADVWRQTPKSCSWCPYREVCNKTDEISMTNLLKAKMVSKPWDFQNPGSGEE